MTAGERLSPLPEEMRPHFVWLNAPHLKRVIDALEAVEPNCARFVGGCVRDSLLGLAPKDFDVATLLTPEQSSRALKAAGLGVAPTGIEHGTITAIVDHQGVEVTTLRADVSTDGRRATVAFTRDWAIDASRRDFTVNAVYLTPDGKLYDPVGGVADAHARLVRFIGDPEDRIREDYLRILRFFRFSARFCEKFDEAGLAACAALKDGIGQLSAERIGAEMSGILFLPRASFALEAMAKGGLLKQIWPASADIKAAALMKEFDPAASAPLMLAALYGHEGEGVGAALRLSNAEKAIRSRALKAVSEISPGLIGQPLRALVYKFGKDGFSDGILLAAARASISAEEFNQMKELGDSAQAPVLSLSGRHIVDAGIKPGPDVSRLLALLEERWIEEDFPGEARQHILLNSLIDAERSQ
jgi:poly(A) polymerase